MSDKHANGRDYDLILPLNEGDKLFCTNGTVFVVEKPFSSDGMRANILFVKKEGDDESDERFVAKIPDIDESRTEKEINARITELRADMLNEINAWNRLSRTPNAEHMFSVVAGSGKFSTKLKDKTKEIDFVVQRFINGITLAIWCRDRFGEPSGGEVGPIFKGIKDDKAWFEIASKILHLVKLIHDQRIVHGDLWPPNIMIRSDEVAGVLNESPVIIDFGRAWLLDHEFHQRGEDKKRFPYYAPELWYKEKKTWYAPADIYSLGGILYYLATGEQPPSPYRGNLSYAILDNLDENELKRRTKSNTELKTEIVNQMIDRNLDLYTKNPGIADVIHYCLRTRIEERAPHANAVLEVIKLFATAFSSQINVAPSIELSQSGGAELIAYSKNLTQILSQIKNPLFRSLVAHGAEKLQAHIVNAGTRLFDIYGEREEIVNGLLTCLATLQHGDQVFALTTPIFWRRHNFGANGRFLTMLKLAALKGVSVRWVLLISKADMKSPSVKTIMQSQSNALIELASNTYRFAKYPSIVTTDRELNGVGYYVGYCLEQDSEYENYIRQAKTFICMNKRIDTTSNFTLFAPAYSERGDGQISIIRCWADSFRWKEELENTLTRLLHESTHVSQFPGIKPDATEVLGGSQSLD